MWGTARPLLLRRGVEMSTRLTADVHPGMDEAGKVRRLSGAIPR